jgi:hypothetical protein
MLPAPTANRKEITAMNRHLMNESNWVQMFRDIGLDDASMRAWHRLFEERHPPAHQSFLEWLGCSEAEIRKIRGR